MKRIIKTFIYLGLLSAVLITSGCQIAGTDNTSTANIEALEGVFAKTHLAEVESDAESAKAVAAKAAVPYSLINPPASIDLPTSTASPITGTVSNYPEYGQTSVYTITLISADVYKVSVVTTYSDWSVRETENEVYYIEDTNNDVKYTTDDKIWNKDRTDYDTRYRETMQTTFRSSFGGAASVRYETIVDDTAPGHTLKLLEPLDSGGMNYDTVASAALATIDSSSYLTRFGTATPVVWSSKVTYTETDVGTSSVVSALFGFGIDDTYTTTGTRYYTEIPDASVSGYQQSNTTLWLEETRAPDGSLVSTSVTREKYYINTTTGARSSKTVKSKTLLYDSKGHKSMYLDKNDTGLSALSYY